ncbi:hypothetical protein LFADAHJC_LOCUS2254 [Methylorubrum extorquens]
MTLPEMSLEAALEAGAAERQSGVRAHYQGKAASGTGSAVTRVVREPA